jgi:hypothetical protein
MRERTSRIFTRLSQGSTPFFLPQKRRTRKGRQASGIVDNCVLSAPLLEWPADDPNRPFGVTAICFDHHELRERGRPAAERLANLRHLIEMVLTSKRRRIKARSKMRS